MNDLIVLLLTTWDCREIGVLLAAYRPLEKGSYEGDSMLAVTKVRLLSMRYLMSTS